MVKKITHRQTAKSGHLHRKVFLNSSLQISFSQHVRYECEIDFFLHIFT